MKTSHVIAAMLCLAAIAGGVFAYRTMRTPPVLEPSAILAVGTDDVLVSHRSELGDVTELELLHARDGASVWRAPMPPIQPEASALAVSGGLAVMASQADRGGSGAMLIAISVADGHTKWTAKVEQGLRAIWAEKGAVVVSTHESSLRAFDLETGVARWEAKGVAEQHAPIFVGGSLIFPTAHALQPALRVVDLRSGAARDVPRGLRWPGAVVDDRYYAIHGAGGGDELAGAAALATGRDPVLPDAEARLDVAAKGTVLAELMLATGSVEPVRIGDAPVTLPDHCVRGTFFTLWKDRVVCDLYSPNRGDDEKPLVSRSWKQVAGPRELQPAPGFRFWGGGSSEHEWLHRDDWPFLAARTRFVPMVQNELRTDNARLCVLDLEELRLTWCSERTITQDKVEIYGWLHIETRGDVHLIHLPLRKTARASVGPLLVLDGNTGKFRGAVDLRAPPPHDIGGFPSLLSHPAPRSGPILVVARDGFLFGLDLATLTLTFQRGPVRLTVMSAISEAESLLGQLPR